MDFAFSGIEPIGSECRRIFLAEADGALARLSDFEDDPDRVIHETRRHNKRLRGLLLLARPVLDSEDLAKANRLVRDAARRFSPARDALVRQETCETLLARFGRKRVGSSLPVVMEALRCRHDRILGDRDFPAEAKAAARDFAEAAKLVEAWDWSQVTYGIAFSGIVSNYRLGLRHFEISRATRDPHECHEWRKRAKYLSFHYQLLAFLDPGEFANRAALAEELASWLGAHHDLAVLEETLAQHEDLGISAKSALTLIRLCEQRRGELEKDAFERGSVVYLDRPETLRKWFDGRVAALA
jgi:CHAD domain-containing protein